MVSIEFVEGTAEIDDIDAFLERLSDIESTHATTIQVFDARYVTGRTHLERAVQLADRARRRGDTIADDWDVEILLYAAGRRQINRALEMGVAAGECPVVAVVVGGDTDAAASELETLLEPAETLGDYDETRVREFFDVGNQELAAADGTLEDIVCERVALLVVER